MEWEKNQVSFYACLFDRRFACSFENDNLSIWTDLLTVQSFDQHQDFDVLDSALKQHSNCSLIFYNVLLSPFSTSLEIDEKDRHELFLVACTRLYNPLCPSVRRSVTLSFLSSFYIILGYFTSF